MEIQRFNICALLAGTVLAAPAFAQPAAPVTVTPQDLHDGGARGIRLVPYVFGASAIGTINAHTTVEPGTLRAAALGAGARLALLRFAVSPNL